MRTWMGVAAVWFATATTAWGQDTRRVAVEAGVVAGVVTPYATVGVVAAPWSIRVSGAESPHNCNGLQLNVGRVVRDQANAKHTIGAMWGRFRRDCQYRQAGRPKTGEYFGLAYDFQAKGFFLEVAPAFGASNPFFDFVGSGPFTRVYGQIGYVHRFGKTYE